MNFYTLIIFIFIQLFAYQQDSFGRLLDNQKNNIWNRKATCIKLIVCKKKKKNDK